MRRSTIEIALLAVMATMLFGWILFSETRPKPGDVLERVEALEGKLEVKPVDVLREVQALREEVRALQSDKSGD